MLVQIAMLLAWNCFSDLPSDRKDSAEVRAEKLYSIAELRRLPPLEYAKYVEELGRRHNFAALEELCKSHFGYAITVYTESLGDKEAIAFCKSFPVGTYEWDHAFWGLSAHPHDAVIGYVKKTCNTKDSWVRKSCYSLCLKAGWDDLIENAKRDVHDDDPMRDAFGQAINNPARSYIRLLPEVQKALRENRKK